MAAGALTGTAEGPPRSTGPASGPFDRRLVRALPVVRWVIGASAVIGMASTAAVVAQAVALARLLASAMPGARPDGRTVDFVVLGAAACLRALLALAAEPVARLGAASAKAELRRRLVGSLVRRAPAEQGRAPGDVATLAGRGLDALDVYLGRCLPDLVLAALAPLALLVAVGILDWLSALILAVAVALFPVFGALVGRASAALARERWRQVEGLGRQVADIFEGMAVLRSFGRSAHQRDRIAQADRALRRASISTLRVAFLSALVLDTLASVSVALVAVPLGLRLLDGTVGLPAALAVLIVAPEVLLPLRRASAEFHESTEGLAAAARAFEVLGEPGAGVLGGPGAGVPGAAGRRAAAPDPALVPVALASVGVAPAGRATPVLHDASLTIGPGERVALVGRNGAGKTTAAMLLLGFLAPSTGTVTVGGEDLAELDLDGWRRHVTYLPADPAIVAGTLADNLRLAGPGATDAELAEALAAAGAPGLIGALSTGLATRIGDGGRPISAGERQRIAVARTLLRPASLYVLDEPTVHLDPMTEALVVASLARATDGASALVITHRPAVLALADRVVTIADGRFVDVPAHAHETGGLGTPAVPAWA